MHEDDARFETHVALFISKLESITAPQDPMARAYALAWMAASSAGSQATFEAIVDETSDHYPWGLVVSGTADRDESAG